MGYFRVAVTLTFKTRLSAKNKCYLHENKKSFHINGISLTLALKQRLGKLEKAYYRGP